MEIIGKVCKKALGLVLLPLASVCHGVSSGIRRIFGTQEQEVPSEEELRQLVSAGEQGGVINPMESQIIDNVFDFGERLAKDIMVPRQDMQCMYVDTSYSETLSMVKQHTHTRYPLCEGDKDHIIGLLHTRDLLGVEEREAFNTRNIMRPLNMVPESMPIYKILEMFQREHMQMAVVVDEYGGTAGLITIEDILEEIVGDITDEHWQEEKQEPPIVERPDGSYELDGLLLLHEVEELLGISFGEEEDDTIGGYVFGKIGRQPQIGDKITYAKWQFAVLNASAYQVLRVEASVVPISGGHC